ncbi:hypothetical protein BAE44_0017204 [Dichanthelium oligosanthes]|uniref:Uncharacterized protein n=1 Tax=Dichanthelium oligosanthes TaxID=888268 RepID=A0A1E5V9P0_9POAL|nr:hypothetical protein BAE44_0017204 [Dichanthelium oligosanthes]
MAQPDLLDDAEMRWYPTTAAEGASSWPSWSSTLTLVVIEFSQSCSICVELVPAALVGDALYFIGVFCSAILRYGLLGRGLSVVDFPEDEYFDGGVMIMPAEDGGLGFASLNRSSPCLSSRETGPDGEAGWVKRRAIDLKVLLPAADSLVLAADHHHLLGINDLLWAS